MVWCSFDPSWAWKRYVSQEGVVTCAVYIKWSLQVVVLSNVRVWLSVVHKMLICFWQMYTASHSICFMAKTSADIGWYVPFRRFISSLQSSESTTLGTRMWNKVYDNMVNLGLVELQLIFRCLLPCQCNWPTSKVVWLFNFLSGGAEIESCLVPSIQTLKEPWPDSSRASFHRSTLCC